MAPGAGVITTQPEPGCGLCDADVTGVTFWAAPVAPAAGLALGAGVAAGAEVAVDFPSGGNVR